MSCFNTALRLYLKVLVKIVCKLLSSSVRKLETQADNQRERIRCAVPTEYPCIQCRDAKSNAFCLH